MSVLLQDLLTVGYGYVRKVSLFYFENMKKVHFAFLQRDNILSSTLILIFNGSFVR